MATAKKASAPEAPAKKVATKAAAKSTATATAAPAKKRTPNPAFMKPLTLSPELAEALFGRPRLPFSISIDFPRFDGPDYERALEMARRSSDYREDGSGATLRHRARFYPNEALQIRDLFEIVGRFDACEVLIDDRPVPYARELWLPLLWFLIA